MGNNINKIKIRWSERANGLTTQCDKKIILLNIQSGEQKPLKKTRRIPKSLMSRNEF